MVQEKTNINISIHTERESNNKDYKAVVAKCQQLGNLDGCMSPLYYSCNFSVSLKWFQNKTFFFKKWYSVLGFQNPPKISTLHLSTNSYFLPGRKEKISCTQGVEDFIKFSGSLESLRRPSSKTAGPLSPEPSSGEYPSQGIEFISQEAPMWGFYFWRIFLPILLHMLLPLSNWVKRLA